MIKIISILALAGASYLFTPEQQNYWPAIKGTWYFAGGGQYETSVIFFFRTRSNRSRFNFFSTDSCEIWKQAYNDVWGPEKYAWKSNRDTVRFMNASDTIAFTIIKLTADELNFKPVYR